MKDLNCIKLDFKYDLNKVLEELHQIENLYLLKLRFMKNWQGIPLRNSMGSSQHDGLELGLSLLRNGNKLSFQECKNTEIMDKLNYIPELIENLKKYLNTEIGMVRILKIPAKQHVGQHQDGEIFDLENGQIYRLHFPLISHPNVKFIINNKNYYFEPGNAYYANVFYPHEIINNSEIDRVHLVVDVLANENIKKLLKN